MTLVSLASMASVAVCCSLTLMFLVSAESCSEWMSLGSWDSAAVSLAATGVLS